MAFINCTHTRNITIYNNASINGMQFSITNGKNDSTSTSFEMFIANFKSLSARASCGGYPGSTDQYARLYKYINGNWVLIISRTGTYTNDNNTSSVTTDITNATKLKVELMAKGGNSDAKCSSTVVIDRLA